MFYESEKEKANSHQQVVNEIKLAKDKLVELQSKEEKILKDKKRLQKEVSDLEIERKGKVRQLRLKPDFEEHDLEYRQLLRDLREK